MLAIKSHALLLVVVLSWCSFVRVHVVFQLVCRNTVPTRFAMMLLFLFFPLVNLGAFPFLILKVVLNVFSQSLLEYRFHQEVLPPTTSAHENTRYSQTLNQYSLQTKLLVYH